MAIERDSTVVTAVSISVSRLAKLEGLPLSNTEELQVLSPGSDVHSSSKLLITLEVRLLEFVTEYAIHLDGSERNNYTDRTLTEIRGVVNKEFLVLASVALCNISSFTSLIVRAKFLHC